MIDPNLSPFVGPLLVLAGVILQFAVRQFKAMPEWAYWLVVVVLTSVVYLLVFADMKNASDLRYDIIQYVMWMVGATATVRGGSSVTDAGARVVQNQNAGRLATSSVAVQMLVPTTNSK